MGDERWIVESGDDMSEAEMAELTERFEPTKPREITMKLWPRDLRTLGELAAAAHESDAGYAKMLLQRHLAEARRARRR